MKTLRRRPALAAGLLAGAVIVVVVAIGLLSGGDDEEGAGAAAANTEDRPFVFVDGAEPSNLDPAVGFSSYDFQVIRNVYDPLVAYERGTTELIPMLATEWSAEDGNRRYRFTLRDGVEFTDGTPFDAEAVKFNIERVLRVNQGPASLLANVDSVEVGAPNQVDIVLKEPDAFFLYGLPKIMMVSPAAVEQHASGDDDATDWLSTNGVGTGPYALESWQKGAGRLELVRNEDYWRGWEDGSLSRIVFQPATELSTRILKVRSGEADFANFVPPQNAEELEGAEGVKVVRSKMLQVMHLPLNTSKGPLQDPLIRQAVVAAFDYAGMVEFFDGQATVPTGPLATNFAFSNEKLAPFEQDMDKARDLLSRSSRPDGGFKLRYCGLAGDAGEEFAGTVLESTLRELDITVEIENMPFAQMVELASSPRTACDISAQLMAPFGADPTVALAQNYAEGSSQNWSFYRNPRVDRLLEQASATPDEARQQVLLDEVQQIVVEDATDVFAVQADRIDVMRDDIEGYVFGPLDYSGMLEFWYLRRS